MNHLVSLALSFGLLSLLAVGGGTAVLPEMQSLLAHQFGIDHLRFVHIYSIGQIAPGPNMLMVLVIGFQVAGLVGAGVVLLSSLVKALGAEPSKMLWSPSQSDSWHRVFMPLARLRLLAR